MYIETLHLIQNRLATNIDKSERNKTDHNNIDELNVKNIQHNPLLIGEQIQKFGLKLKSINFYHFHATLPEIEKNMPSDYYNASSKLENPSDWRGNFMASAFVVHAIKI